MIRLGQSLGDFIEQFLGLSQSPLIGTKFRLVHNNQTNPFMTIIIDFRLFLKTSLASLQMLIPLG